MKKIILYPVMVLAMALLFYSCEDNTGIESIDDQKQYVTVYMPRAVDSSPTNKIIISDTTYSFQYSAYVGGPLSSDQDIHVTFGVEAAAVDSFNTKNGTNYVLMPKDSYTLETNDGVIPVGQRSTKKFNMKIDASSQELKLKTYLLPISITKVSGTMGSISQSVGTRYYIFQTSYANIDRSDWNIIGFDSYQHLPNNSPTPEKAIDGNQKTFWHTPWVRPRPTPPYYISVDMGEKQIVHGLKIVGRLGKTPFTSQGNPIDIVIKVSNDTTNWGKGEHFTLPFDVKTVKKSVYLSSSLQSRYIKIIINSTVKDKKFTHIAEIYAF